MSRPLIVIADTDEAYLSTLEYKFLTESDDNIELEIISDKEYFRLFFSEPKTAEMVAVSEELYTLELKKHNIANLYVLSENTDSGHTEELAVTHVYKYAGIKEIYNELMYRSIDKITKNAETGKTCQVIALYSAIGGSGKTSVGIGLAGCLSQNHRKVLYISTESVQDFAFYLQDKSGMPNEGYRAMRDDIHHIYHNIRHFIRQEGFSYVPPLLSTLDTRNLDITIYGEMIADAKRSGEYDFIIVDVEAGYSPWQMKLLQEADRVILVVLQDGMSTTKMECLTRSLDFSDKEKYMVICNRYYPTKDNAYLKSELQSHLAIQEYVQYTDEVPETVQQLVKLEGIEKLSYMFW